MGKRQVKHQGTVWNLGAGRLNAAISALDRELASVAPDTMKYFLGIAECPGFAESVAKGMFSSFYANSADACIALGYEHVISMMEAQKLWEGHTDKTPFIHTLVTNRYTQEDLEGAAMQNGSGRHNWRLVFYSGNSIGKQMSRYPRYFVAETGGVIDLLIPTKLPTIGVYLIDFKPAIQRDRNMQYTPESINRWFKSCSAAERLEVIPPALFTEALISFMALSRPPLTVTNEWYNTCVPFGETGLKKTLAIQYDYANYVVRLAGDVPAAKDGYFYVMKAPRKSAL